MTERLFLYIQTAWNPASQPSLFKIKTIPYLCKVVTKIHKNDGNAQESSTIYRNKQFTPR